MRAVIGCSGLALLGTLFLVGSVDAADQVEVKVVKYTVLADTVKAAKGKIVVVDFWAWW
jgi:hypothetical protein